MPERYATFSDAGIELPRNAKGNTKAHCPQCHSERRNKSDKSLSVNVADGLWNCHHCGWKGHLTPENAMKPAYIIPEEKTLSLGPQSLAWLTGTRKLSETTLRAFKIGDSSEWMPEKGKHPAGHRQALNFPYYRDGKLVNVKLRDGAKCFRLTKGAELIFFNLDRLKERDDCIITEGEFDAMSFYEAGLFGAVSVPNGASKGSQKLEYLDNCSEAFDGMKKIYLATDGDEAGLLLREELARRLGKERCWLVSYPKGCKDANEVLVKFGKEAVKALIDTATPYPLEGIVSEDELAASLQSLYDNGLPEGAKTGFVELDKLISFGKGLLTMVTGIPGSGKSVFTDQIMERLATRHDWRFGVFSAEKQPTELHAKDLMTQHVGRPFWGENRMNEAERQKAFRFVTEHFYFIKVNDIDRSIDGILAKARELVLRKGITGLLIDPYNYIEHQIPKGYSETQYISELLTKIKTFCLVTGVHCFLIAHPTKISKDKTTKKYEIPTLYHISGSAHFFNKGDNGFVVYRDFETDEVFVAVQKIRWSWQGELGATSFYYDKLTCRYRGIEQGNFPGQGHPAHQPRPKPETEDKAPVVVSNSFPIEASSFAPELVGFKLNITVDDDEMLPF